MTRRRRRYGGAALGIAAALTVAVLAVVAAGVLLTHRSRPDVPPGPGDERVWHVAAGAAGGGTGSADRPFRRIQAALDAAAAGDTVQVRAGTYAGDLRTVRAGRPGRPIRLVGHAARVAAGDATHGLTIAHDHIEVTGFDLVGGNSTVLLHGARHVRLVANTVRDAEGECVRVKFGSRHNEIAHNRIHGCGREHFDLEEDSKNGEAVYIGTAPEQRDRLPDGKPDHSDHNWIHHNTLRAPAECVDIKEDSSHTLVERNECAGGQDPDGAGLSTRGDYNTLRGNIIRGGAGAGIRLGGDDDDQGVHTTVAGNVIAGPAGYGIKIMRRPQTAICGNTIRASQGATNGDRHDPGRPCPGTREAAPRPP